MAATRPIELPADSHNNPLGASPDAALMLDLAKSVIDARGRENDLLRGVIAVQQRHVEELETRLLALSRGAHQ